MSALENIYKKPYLERTRLEQCITQAFFSDEHMHWRNEAAAELAAKDAAIEAAIKALRAVVHDRPTAHTDEVWEMILQSLSKLEALK